MAVCPEEGEFHDQKSAPSHRLRIDGGRALSRQGDANDDFFAFLSHNPGLSTKPSSGTYRSDPGPLDCKGGGRGTIEFSGNYGTKDPDSCTSGGEGYGTTIFKFADGGTVTDDGINFTYGPFQGGALGGSWKGKSSSGTFEVTSIEGDCVTRPMTKAHAVFRNVVVKR